MCGRLRLLAATGFCLEAQGCRSFPGYRRVRNLNANSYDSPDTIVDQPNSFCSCYRRVEYENCLWQNHAVSVLVSWRWAGKTSPWPGTEKRELLGME